SADLFQHIKGTMPPARANTSSTTCLKLCHAVHVKQAGFTLIELLVVIAILAVLAAVVITAIDPRKVQDEAKFAQTKQHLQTLATALETYTIHSGGVYPADVDRGIPPGLESYLKTGDWPNTPWGGPSTYDWDNYIDDDTGQQVY